MEELVGMGARPDVAQAMRVMANYLFDGSAPKPAKPKSPRAHVKNPSLYGIVMRIAGEQSDGVVHLFSRAVGLVNKMKKDPEFLRHVEPVGSGTRTRYRIKNVQAFEGYVRGRIQGPQCAPVIAAVVEEKPCAPVVAPPDAGLHVADSDNTADSDVPEGYFSLGQVQEKAKIGDLRDYLRRNKRLRPVLGEPEMIGVKGKLRPFYLAQNVHAFLCAMQRPK